MKTFVSLRFLWLIPLIILFNQAYTQTNQPINLIDAIKQNNQAAINRLLQKGTDVNITDSNGANALMWAAYKGDIALFKTLVRLGALPTQNGFIYIDTSQTSYYGNLLGIAAANNDSALLVYCLDSLHIPVDDKEYNHETKQKDGWTALHWAANSGKLESVRILLRAGANINQAYFNNQESLSPLAFAIMSGNNDLINFIASQKNIDLNAPIINGITPLMIIASGENPVLCITFLKNGADAFIPDKNNMKAFDYAFKNENYNSALIIEKWLNGYSYQQLQILQDSVNNWYKLYLAGDSCYQKEQYDCAMNFKNLELQYCKVLFGENHPKYATLLSDKATVYMNIGEYKKALPLFQQSIGIIENNLGLKNQSYAAILNNFAVYYKTIGDYKNSLILYQRVLELTKDLFGDNHSNYVKSLNNIGLLYTEMGDYNKAFQSFQSALNVSQSLYGDFSLEYAAILNGYVWILIYKGEYDLAFSLSQKALKIKKEILGDTHTDYAVSLNTSGSIFELIGNFEEALLHFQQASDIFKNAFGEENINYATSLSDLAQLYRKKGNYDKSISLYQEALYIKKKVLGENHSSYATALFNLAEVYNEIGHINKVSELLLQVSDIFTNVYDKTHPNFFALLNSYAVLLTKNGKYEMAIKILNKLIESNKIILGEKNPQYVTLLTNLGLAYEKSGNPEKALSLYQDADKVIQTTFGDNHLEYAGTLKKRADLLRSKGDFELALQNYRKALDIVENKLGKSHPTYAKCLSELAIVYININNHIEASKIINFANSVFLETMQNGFYYLDQTAMLQFIKNYSSYFEVGNSIANNYCDTSLISQGFNYSLLFKGIVLQNSKDLLSDLDQLKDSIQREVVNKFRTVRHSLSKAYQDNFNDLKTDSLLALLGIYEQQLMKLSPAYRQKVESRNIQWQQVQQQLKPNEAAIEFVEFDYWNKKWTDTTVYAAFLLLPNQAPKMVSLCTKKMLAARFLNSPLKDSAYIKQLYSKGDSGVTLYNAKDTRQVRAGLYDGNMGVTLYNAKDTVPSLYDLLWQPLDSLLTGINTIYYAPDGLLHRINLAAINFEGSKVLSSKYAFHLMGSVRDIVGYQPTYITQPTDTLLAYGGIDYNTDSTSLATQSQRFSLQANPYAALATRNSNSFYWKNLEGTLEEVDAIKQLAVDQQMPAHFFTRQAATEESFNYYSQQQKSPAIIHIATHGFFYDAVQPKPAADGKPAPYFMSSVNAMQRSGIVFAGANRVTSGKEPYAGIEDGIVTANEISNASLQNTKLMVLSACETGLGKIENTEGVFGLQRGIRMSGCKNLIMSLWQVPDYKTAEFMKYFYTELLKAKKSIYDAFQSAQTKMRDLNSDDPFNWAAFVLME